MYSIPLCGENFTNKDKCEELVEVFYSVRCAAAARPQGRARAPVRQQPRSHGPGHRGGPRRAASTLPAPKPPAVFASLFLPACLQISSAESSRVSLPVKRLHFSCMVAASPPVRLPWSFLQSTISTCASRCSLALAHRARDKALFPLPCGETTTRVMTFLSAQRVEQFTQHSPWHR